MRRCGILLFVTCGLAGCHLAEDVSGPSCEAGTHALNGTCAADAPLDGPSIVISAGMSCAPTPASLTVPVNGSFRFENDDGVDHVITGSDGMVWVSALTGQASPFIGITKVG